MFNKMNNNMGMENMMHGGYMDKGPCGCGFKPIVKERCCCRPRKVCYTVCDCCYTKKFTKKMPDNCCCPDMKNDFYGNDMVDNSWGNSYGSKDNYGWSNARGMDDNFMGENADMYGENDMDGNYWG